MTLDMLQQGATAKIIDIQGDDGITIRLFEMGLTQGEQVKLVGVAPLGDPLEFELRGYRLSLRKSEANRVQIELS